MRDQGRGFRGPSPGLLPAVRCLPYRRSRTVQGRDRSTNALAVCAIAEPATIRNARARPAIIICSTSTGLGTAAQDQINRRRCSESLGSAGAGREADPPAVPWEPGRRRSGTRMIRME